jgi:hypothetical protein
MGGGDLKYSTGQQQNSGGKTQNSLLRFPEDHEVFNLVSHHLKQVW